MEKSKIVIALEKFTRDYAWDKSLTTSSRTPATSQPAPSSESSALDRFLEQQGDKVCNI